MNVHRTFALVGGGFFLVVPMTLGWLLHCTGVWVVHHESINYSLPRMLSSLAEIFSAVGPVVPIATAFVFGLPPMLGALRLIRSLLFVTAISVLAALMLTCALGSLGAFANLSLAGTSSLLWIAALVWALSSTPPPPAS